jgi:hypothetical protein
VVAALSCAWKNTEALLAAEAQTTAPSWDEVRKAFDLAPDRIHMSAFFLAPIPKPVREAVEEHRRAFDRSPMEYLLEETIRGINGGALLDSIGGEAAIGLHPRRRTTLLQKGGAISHGSLAK